MQKERLIPGVTKLYVRVPIDRIGVLIGENGEIKHEIERRTQTKITVSSSDGTVIIEPETQYVPPINLLKAREIVRAISLGFSPEKAFRLLEDDYVLVVIDLKQYVGDSPNHLSRIKGRIIGEKGKARKTIEEMTNTYISVYGTYVAIIGDYESATVAREAIEMLIQGRQHSTVYRYLDRMVYGLKKRRMLSLWRDNY